ncbi:MAG: LamB/YcsF family protein [Fimbriimonadaceae bacterium]|nr:LamB/YcsF family protein [Chthonomonadaceae bacterium]MCO5295870.1 LamB/YcsF family protein [Fimbriimonadaceae bacterium]
MKRVDLNVDIAEGFPFDAPLLEFATSANICCGVHAGSPELTAETVARCRERGIRIGAHPGYPDRESMGRREPATDEREAFLDSAWDQIRNFAGFQPAYVKPHGALYNWLSRLDASEAAGAKRRLRLQGTAVMALAETKWAECLGSFAIREGFVDRLVLENGRLAPRSEPGAVLHDPAEVAAQALRLAPRVDTLCLHGDTEGCLELAETVVRALRDSGWELGW